NSELFALHSELKLLFFKYFGKRKLFVWTLLNSGIGISRCARDLEKAGGFAPVQLVHLSQRDDEMAITCIMFYLVYTCRPRTERRQKTPLSPELSSNE